MVCIEAVVSKDRHENSLMGIRVHCEGYHIHGTIHQTELNPIHSQQGLMAIIDEDSCGKICETTMTDACNLGCYSVSLISFQPRGEVHPQKKIALLHHIKVL